MPDSVPSKRTLSITYFPPNSSIAFDPCPPLGEMIDVAVAAPDAKVTVALVYPVPGFVIVTAVTIPPAIVEFAVAPVPSPVMVTPGAAPYPEPPAVTFTT